MQKTILITGSTDGIGFQTAKRLVKEGHNVLIHGRSSQKVKDVETKLKSELNGGTIDSCVADLSNISDVKVLVNEIKQKYTNLDVLINNAGVFNVPQTITKDNLDVRFVVNTIAPYFLTKELMPLFTPTSRVVNLSSAAQAPVNIGALKGETIISSASDAYAQSKLALTMWSFQMAQILKDSGPIIIAVNPKSSLGSKMVKDAYGVAGADLSIGADILCRASLSDEFENARGKYFNNDIGAFDNPHPDALNEKRCKTVIEVIEETILKIL